jgi:drug/metabolite transporter (DMT)-like permease
MSFAPGIAFALVSAALFGASTPLAKALLGDVSPWLLAGLLYLGSGFGLGMARSLRRLHGGVPTEASLTRADLPWLATVVLAGGVVGPVLLMFGLGTTPASAAALLLNMEGVFTLGIAWVVFRENVDLRIGLGALAILAGALLLSWPGGASGLSWGALAVAGACLAWAIDNNLTRKLSSADPLQVAIIKGSVAGIVNVVLAFGLGAVLPPAGALLGAALVGFFGYGISLVLFVLALRHLGAARTGAYFSLAPFAGALVAIIGFGEPVTVPFAAAAVLMGIGLYLHIVERHVHLHAHEPIEHEHGHTHDEHHEHEHAIKPATNERHVHYHRHATLVHRHPHYPELHHRHSHR